jgi:hypothetical protein
VLLLTGILVAWLASRDTADETSSLAYAPDAYVHGASLDTWSARHWQWTLGFPVSTSPGMDPTGASCMVGQHGPVFFMARNLAPCTVPEGAVVLIPVAGAECSSVEREPFTGDDEKALRDCASADVDRYTNISVTVNGTLVPEIARYRIGTELFNVVLPEHNILGAAPGAAWVIADGYNVLLRPLPPGEHTVIVHTETVDGVVLPDKLLRLTVVAPAWDAPIVPVTPGTPAASPGATPQAP